ncbi:MAG: GIY-YIG nuclease family protein [Bacteroidota bacterium]
MYYVYILHSLKLDKFYVGQTEYLPSERLDQHNNSHFSIQFTKSGVPWTLFLVLTCTGRKHALLVENTLNE